MAEEEICKNCAYAIEFCYPPGMGEDTDGVKCTNKDIAYLTNFPVEEWKENGYFTGWRIEIVVQGGACPKFKPRPSITVKDTDKKVCKGCAYATEFLSYEKESKFVRCTSRDKAKKESSINEWKKNGFLELDSIEAWNVECSCFKPIPVDPDS